jgi:hypothetical protein
VTAGVVSIVGASLTWRFTISNREAGRVATKKRISLLSVPIAIGESTRTAYDRSPGWRLVLWSQTASIHRDADGLDRIYPEVLSGTLSAECLKG